MKHKPRDSTPMQLFPLLVMDLFQNIVQAGKGLENSACLWDRAGNFAAVRSPWRCCGSRSDEVSVWQSHSDRPGLNRRKKLSTNRNILFYFLELLLDSEEKLFERVYQHTGSTNNSTMLLGLFSILQCCEHIAWLRVCHAATCACNALMSSGPN